MQDADFTKDDDHTKEERVNQSKVCADETGMPLIDKERRKQVKETIKDAINENATVTA